MLVYVSSRERCQCITQADRSTGSPADLQRLTVDYVHARHSPDDRVSSRESHHDRDEVSGPLSTKGNSDDLQTRTVRDIHSEEHDEISGPLRDAVGVKNSNQKGNGTGKRVKRTFTEERTEETLATFSEQNVRARTV